MGRAWAWGVRSTDRPQKCGAARAAVSPRFSLRPRAPPRPFRNATAPPALASAGLQVSAWEDERGWRVLGTPAGPGARERSAFLRARSRSCARLFVFFVCVCGGGAPGREPVHAPATLGCTAMHAQLSSEMPLPSSNEIRTHTHSTAQHATLFPTNNALLVRRPGHRPPRRASPGRRLVPPGDRVHCTRARPRALHGRDNHLPCPSPVRVRGRRARHRRRCPNHGLHPRPQKHAPRCRRDGHPGPPGRPPGPGRGIRGPLHCSPPPEPGRLFAGLGGNDGPGKEGVFFFFFFFPAP